MYAQTHREPASVLGGVDRFDSREVAQQDIEVCDEVVDLALAQPGQQRILSGEGQADSPIVHGLPPCRQREFEISSGALLALDQLLVQKNGRAAAESCLVCSHQLAHLRTRSRLVNSKVGKYPPFDDVDVELSPIDLGGASRQFVRKPKQQAGHILLEMEMGLLAAGRPGRHARRPLVANDWIADPSDYWPFNSSRASESLTGPATKSPQVASRESSMHQRPKRARENADNVHFQPTIN